MTTTGSGGRRAPLHILTARSPAPYSPTTPRCAHPPTAFSGPMARSPASPALAPCSHPQTGPQDSTTSHNTVLARPVCPFVYVGAVSSPLQVVRFGFQLPPRLRIRVHTLSLDSHSRPTAGKSSSPAGLSTLVCAYAVDLAPAPLYTYSSSAHRFPDEHTPIEATPL